MRVIIWYNCAMRKRGALIAVLLLVCSVALIALAACGNNTKTLYFSSASYEMYLSESRVLTPEITTSPRGREYTLTSSNPSIVSVNDDGVSVTAHKEGLAVLTASSGNVTATTDILVFTERASASVPTENDGKYVVYFTTSYGSVPAQRVSPGECATEPAPPYREGYVLFGWYKDSEYKIPYDFSAPVTSNLFLYALWAYAEPEYAFEVVDDEVVLTGFKYSFIPYADVELPSEDENGSPIVAIKDNAFAENASLKSVVIPSSYREIGLNAFAKCTALETVTVSDGVEKICDNAFADCTALKTVNFSGNSLREIGPAAFINCSLLTSALLPDSVAELGMRAFAECSALAEVNIPASLSVIREETFAYTALTEVDLKNTVSIYNKAFWGAAELAAVSGGNALREAGSYIFGSLLSTQAHEAAPWLLTAGENYSPGGKPGGKATYLGNVLIYVHPVETKPLPVYVKPNTVSIAAQAFSDVNYATAVFTTDAPPTYGAEAFGSSSGVPAADIVVPAGTTEKYTRAFLVTSKDEDGYYVPNAYSLALVQKIYENAKAPFDGIVYYRYPLKADESGVYFSKLQAAAADDPYAGLTYRGDAIYYVLHSYSGTASSLDMNDYMATDTAYRGDSARVPYLEKVSAYAFSSNSALTSVVLPNRTLRIESYAFMECTGLNRIRMEGASALDEGKTFVPASVTQTSFNLSLMPSSFRIYVPEALYDYYYSGWSYSTLRGKLSSYTP